VRRPPLALFILSGLIALWAGIPLPAPAAPPPDAEARAILREIDDLWRSGSSKGTVRMEVKTVNYTRTMTKPSWP